MFQLQPLKPGRLPLRSEGRFSKRDYEIFARVLKDTKPLTTVDNKDLANMQWASVVSAIAQMFKEDNEKFDLIKFVARLHEHEKV